MPHRLWNPWRLVRVPHPAVSREDEHAFDALLARTPEGGVVDYDLARPKWWFLHHAIRRGYLLHGSRRLGAQGRVEARPPRRPLTPSRVVRLEPQFARTSLMRASLKPDPRRVIQIS